MADLCVVEVGHGADERATWRDLESGTTVCDRHRSQYDERSDLGPYEWVTTTCGCHDCRNDEEAGCARGYDADYQVHRCVMPGGHDGDCLGWGEDRG